MEKSTKPKDDKDKPKDNGASFACGITSGEDVKLGEDVKHGQSN